MKVLHIISVWAVIALFSFSCTRSVTRVSPDTQIDLSGRWNDSDSRIVADKMVDAFLSSNRYKEYAQKHGATPTIIV